jgi:NADH-quinone oxidoreductase subunit N
MTLGAFACILALRTDNAMIERIDEMAGLSRTRPGLAAMLAILMFSLAGIPPLAGFFGKFYVFRAAIEAELYTLAVLGVLASVVGAFYYLRIVKVMYIDEPSDRVVEPVSSELGWIAAGLSAFSLLFFVYPRPLIELAQAAAATLINGATNSLAALMF